jgi:deazaflavin-dependent oxidoreductase (nitroreductase family)
MEPEWRNPFLGSRAGARALSALTLPFFLIRPPAGYGVLTTTGRRTGKRRRRCVRLIRSGSEVYVVAINKSGLTPHWSKNALANPELQVRIAGGTFSGRARRPRDTAEIERVRKAFCGAVHATDYLTWINWRKALPTHTRIEGLLREWFEEGTPLVIELDVARQRAVQRKRATERASR